MNPVSYPYFALRFAWRDRITSSLQILGLFFFMLFFNISVSGKQGQNPAMPESAYFSMTAIILVFLATILFQKSQRRLADTGIIQAIGASRLQVCLLFFIENSVLAAIALAAALLLGPVLPPDNILPAVSKLTFGSITLLFSGAALYPLLGFLFTWLFSRQDPYRSIRRGR